MKDPENVSHLITQTQREDRLLKEPERLERTA